MYYYVEVYPLKEKTFSLKMYATIFIESLEEKFICINH